MLIFTMHERFQEPTTCYIKVRYFIKNYSILSFVDTRNMQLLIKEEKNCSDLSSKDTVLPKGNYPYITTEEGNKRSL